MYKNMSKSWRQNFNPRRHAIAESDSSTEGFKENLLTKSFSDPDPATFCSNCCTCKVSDNQTPRSKQNLLTSRSDSKLQNKFTPYREQLEMKVLNDEMNEQVSHEKYNNNKKLVDDLTMLLRSVSIYVHCIDIRHKAAERLQSLLSEVLPINEPPYEDKVTNSWLIFSNKLSEIMCSCNENIELPPIYYECLNEYKDKYKDYTKASSNFCQILENEVNMTNSQLRKLELQYDEIRANYNNSKTSIASHFSSIIRKRSEAVDTSIQALLPIFNEVIEEDKNIYDFLKGISFRNIKCERTPSSKSLQDKSRISHRRKLEVEKSCSCSQNNRNSHN